MKLSQIRIMIKLVFSIYCFSGTSSNVQTPKSKIVSIHSQGDSDQSQAPVDDKEKVDECQSDEIKPLDEKIVNVENSR